MDIVQFNNTTLDSSEDTNISNKSVQNGSLILSEDLLILMRVVPFLVPVLFSIIIVIGFIGNILVVCVVFLNQDMRNTTNLLILNLAVSFIEGFWSQV